MFHTYIKKNISAFSLLIFFILFLIVSTLKPSLIYNKDGSFKNFGLGYKTKTIFPMWLMVIIMAVFSYTIILFSITIPKLQF